MQRPQRRPQPAEAAGVQGAFSGRGAERPPDGRLMRVSVSEAGPRLAFRAEPVP